MMKESELHDIKEQVAQEETKKLMAVTTGNSQLKSVLESLKMLNADVHHLATKRGDLTAAIKVLQGGQQAKAATDQAEKEAKAHADMIAAVTQKQEEIANLLAGIVKPKPA